jgi:SM-20-related protein
VAAGRIEDFPASPSFPASQSTIADDLSAQGWSQQDKFLPTDLTAALASECRALMAAGELRFAAVGRGAMREVRTGIRSDKIAWLKAGQSTACDRYLVIMESLRITLNRSLFLGLDDYESHFAFYSPGATYLKHLDRFRDDDRRTVSVVIYLNPDWLEGEGGALRLYPEGLASEDIAPVGGRLLLFLSADMQHEVMPATRNRLSLAGWFRRRQ